MHIKSRKIENVIFILLLLVGFTINFLPTVNYYLNVYPHLYDNISSGAFIEYSIDVFFALVEIPSKSGNTTTVVFDVKQGILRLTYVNETMLRYNLTAIVELSFPFNETFIDRELRSEGFISWNSTLGQLLVLPPGNNSEVTVNISSKVVKLEKVPPNVVSFSALLNPSFYLKPIAYHGKWIPEINSSEAIVYFTYWELENGDLLFTSHAYSKNRQPIDDLAIQIVRVVFSGEPSLMELIDENSDKISGLRLLMGVNDANVKVKNDLLGRILFDFTVTYFPVNIALMMVGFVGLILVHRGRI